jgi:hypothetical protein
MGERFVTPAGAVLVVDWIVIVWFPASAPGGIVIELPCSVTVPPCEETGWLMVAPLPMTGPVLPLGAELLEQPASGPAQHTATTPSAKRFRNLMFVPLSRRTRGIP